MTQGPATPLPQQQEDGIRARGLTVTYRNGHTALRRASFEAPGGSISALVGVNGAGKSTLFKAVMGFAPVAAGEVAIFGLPVREALRRNLVAYVPQAEEVDWSFPVLVEDVVMMGRFGHMGLLRIPRARDRAAVDEALARVNMTEFRRRQIGELSGGQRKRVFLARALAQEGRAILLDEPFTGVDVKTEEQIIALLRDLRDEGRAMLVSTHNLGSVPEFCDRTILVKGTVLAEGPTAEVFTRRNLAEAFGGVLRRFTIGGQALHDDDDPRELQVLTDDERPIIHYDGRIRTAEEVSKSDAHDALLAAQHAAEQAAGKMVEEIAVAAAEAAAESFRAAAARHIEDRAAAGQQTPEPQKEEKA